MPAMPIEHPSIRCPTCGRGAVDVAPNHNPFDPLGFGDFMAVLSTAVSATCPGGHAWIVGQQYDSSGQPDGPRQTMTYTPDA